MEKANLQDIDDEILEEVQSSWSPLKAEKSKKPMPKYRVGEKVGKYGTYLGERGIYDTRNELNGLAGKEWARFTKSWFILNPPPRKKNEVLHPAKFPEPLVVDFITFFTKKGEMVLDPMAGTGSALVACDQTERKGVGIELGKKWYEIANGRTHQKMMLGDARNVDVLLKEAGITQIDFCMTSPPYWNMLHKTRGHVKSAAHVRKEQGLDETYSNDPNDLGNVDDYEQYLNFLTDIYFKIYDLLKDKRYLVIAIQNILTPDGEMVPLAWDLAKKLSKKYVLKQEKLWLQNNKMLGIWGYPNRYVSSVHHHYCLIFEKNTNFKKLANGR